MEKSSLIVSTVTVFIIISILLKLFVEALLSKGAKSDKTTELILPADFFVSLILCSGLWITTLFLLGVNYMNNTKTLASIFASALFVLSFFWWQIKRDIP